VLVDSGMFQGGQNTSSKNRAPVPKAGKLSAVLLTHAHLDHSGRLPLLVRQGYQGPVFATPASVEMAALILRDSAKIQAQDLERQNRKRERAGLGPEEPLYTPQDAEAVIQLFQPVSYRAPVEVAPGVKAIWNEAGHMLGSASIKILAEEEGRQRSIVFSGDLGPKTAPILKEFEPFREADVFSWNPPMATMITVRSLKQWRNSLQLCNTRHDRAAKILVPTFAVARAQLLTMLLSWMFRNKKVEPFPVFLDSPHGHRGVGYLPASPGFIR
jgi:metallo-beta-lactamase family protein